MPEINFRTLGSVLIGLSIILIFIFAFVKSNIDKEESFLCNAVHVSPELTMDQCPVHSSNNSWLLIAAFGIIFMILISGFYLLFMPFSKSNKKEEQKEFKKIDITKLDEEEKKVYEELKKNNGSMYQSSIIKETQYSKVRTTRILDRLSNKGIIDRQRRGMTNIVILK